MRALLDRLEPEFGEFKVFRMKPDKTINCSILL